MNALIRIVPEFTVSAVARALVQVDESARGRESLSVYRDALQAAPDEVVRVIDEFWAITLMTLRDNSPPLRAYLKLRARASKVGWLKQSFTAFARPLADLTRSLGWPTTWRAYQVGRDRRSASSSALEAAHT